MNHRLAGQYERMDGTMLIPSYRRGRVLWGLGLVLMCLVLLPPAASPARAATLVAAQTQHIGGVYVTVVKHVRMAGAPIMGDTTNTYLVVFVRVTNRSHAPVSPFGEREFALTGAGGQSLARVSTCGDEGYQTALSSVSRPTLCSTNTGTLSPGQSIYGSMTFAAPRHQHRATLVWTLDDSTTLSARWTITY